MNVVDNMFQHVVVKIAQIRSEFEELPLVFIRLRAVDRGRAVDADVLLARALGGRGAPFLHEVEHLVRRALRLIRE